MAIDLYQKLQLQIIIYQFLATGGTIEVYIAPLSDYEGMPGCRFTTARDLDIIMHDTTPKLKYTNNFSPH
jgi:hypothetical protein